jgi:hypothetical protein
MSQSFQNLCVPLFHKAVSGTGYGYAGASTNTSWGVVNAESGQQAFFGEEFRQRHHSAVREADVRPFAMHVAHLNEPWLFRPPTGYPRGRVEHGGYVVE